MQTDTIAVRSQISGFENFSGISRRSLFQWGIFGLFTRLFAIERVLAIPAGTAEGTFDPEWLVKWRAANRKPVWESNDPDIHAIIGAIRLNQSIPIRYFGGSSPGESRVITPSLVFTCDGYSGGWVSAYCHARGEQRTFRLDGISLK